MLQTIYVLKKENLQFWGLESTIYNQERVTKAHVWYICPEQGEHFIPSGCLDAYEVCKSKQSYFYLSGNGKMTDLSIPEIDSKTLKNCF